MKKKIAFFTISMRFGGTERVVSILLKYFPSSEYEKYLILLENDIKYEIPQEVRIICLHNKIPTRIGKFFSLIIDPFKLTHILSKFKIDTVVSFLERPNIINIASCVFRPHYVVASVRSILSYQYKNSGMYGNFMQVLNKIFLRKADIIVPNSFSAKRDLIKNFGVPSGKIKVIYNPLDTEKIKKAAKEEPADFIFEKDPVVINVARFNKIKNHELLINSFAEVARKHENIKLLLVGDGETRKELETKCKNLGLDGKVIFLGNKKNPFKYMARSTFFVLSSLAEGFPNALAEALVCGLPVISTLSSDSICEILSEKPECVPISGKPLKEKFGIIIKRNDQKALVKAMEMLICNEDLRHFYSVRAPLAVEKFSAEKIVLQWKSLLKTGPKD